MVKHQNVAGIQRESVKDTATSMVLPPPLPSEFPLDYAPLSDEPSFDAALHLAPELPRKTWMLAELGYGDDEIAALPSAIGITAPFRLLSEAGVRAMRDVALALASQSRTSDRTANYVTGAVYRSRFFRDFCNAPEIAEFMSHLAGCRLAAHSMPSQQTYINYAPKEVGKAVDTWHTDGIGFDYVLLLTDPQSFDGGKFQFFRGTRDEAAEILKLPTSHLTEAIAADLPEHRVETVEMPAAGYAVFQQGSHIVHRATGMHRAGERITVVPGLVACDTSYADTNRVGTIAHWNEPGLATELVRHKAWLTNGRLDALVRELPIEATPQAVAAALRRAVADANELADILDPPNG